MRQAQELSVTFSVLTDDPLLGIGSGGASLDQPAVTNRSREPRHALFHVARQMNLP